MQTILSKYPLIYLLLFFFGCLVLGLELGEVYKSDFPTEPLKYWLKISGLVFTLVLSVFFFYRFLRSRRGKKSQN